MVVADPVPENYYIPSIVRVDVNPFKDDPPRDLMTPTLACREPLSVELASNETADAHTCSSFLKKLFWKSP